jgi:hypothetical protein
MRQTFAPGGSAVEHLLAPWPLERAVNSPSIASADGTGCMKENAMSDSDDVSRKTTQKARETMEKGKQTAEESVRAVEQSYSTAFENVRDLNVKLIDIAQANAEAVCDFARDIATVKAPSDMLEVWMDHSRKQFEMATKHAGDLRTLGQKMATESTGPMARSAEQAFRRGTT